MKILMKGNEAIGEGAIRAGCRYFFGYPITPQSELPAYLAEKFPSIGGVFLQAESEISAINMVYGASCAGVRVMTSSSSPGISLKQEGISYLAAAELPCLIVNVMRGGPGLGTIQPSQSDYFQATKGGGHGDYHLIVLAPHSVQEMVDLTYLAFDLADQYRNPAMILADGILGQMMEAVELKEYASEIPHKNWAVGKSQGRKRNIITSIYIDPKVLEQHNLRLQAKYKIIKAHEERAEEWMKEDAEIIIAAYGTVARIAKSVIKKAREKGIKAGLIRPITLWPFPDKYFQDLGKIKRILTVELSSGQMVEDVRLAVNGRIPVEFYGRMGGMVPSIEEILEQIEKINSQIERVKL
ncbi:MAG: 3-methyl-2-oxobutanoate dehydrogenase subunit VorB [Armatimonadetes bacterium]|nr:3-methyl-2-oxobutanoate dehydrogenase subunit VorB [Armatimonadota bacterium]